jgi:hypothetical protein
MVYLLEIETLHARCEESNQRTLKFGQFLLVAVFLDSERGLSKYPVSHTPLISSEWLR